MLDSVPLNHYLYRRAGDWQPGQPHQVGHGALGAGCMPKLFSQFIEKTDAKALDGKCLDTLAYPSPFISFNGAQP